MSDRVARTIAAYDRTAGDFANRNWEIAEVAAIREHFLGCLSNPPEGYRKPSGGLVVLDAGCGPGRDLAAFRQAGCRVVGIDLSAGMLAEARRRVPGAILAQMDLRTLAFAEESFDGIWAMASLLHVPKDEATGVLVDFRRLVRPGGLLLLALKAGAGDVELQDADHADAWRYFVYYQPAEVIAALQAAGWDVLQTEQRGQDRSGRPWLTIYARRLGN